MSNKSTNNSAVAKETDPEPLLKVVRGNPTEEELAALTAVVRTLSVPPARARAPRQRQRARSWIRRRQLQLKPAPGPGAWRRSSR